MNIYVAYTGGTIGMVPSDNGYIPDAEFAKTIAAILKAAQPEHRFHVTCYERLIDSSNARPEDWRLIADDIQTHWSQYDGFMVLHGTDTMAYTSSALAFMFQQCDKPIVVTGSQIPMVKSRNDALTNVFGALDAILNGPKGVFLFFGNLLIEGARARKVDTSALQAFESPNALPRGVLGIEWQWRKMHLPQSPMVSKLPNMISGVVVLLPVFPGVSVEHWQGLLTSKVKGAVLLSYGAGNAPDQDASLLALLKAASDRGVVIANVSQCGRGSVSAGTYAAGSALVKAGVVSAVDMTFEAAFAKLHYLIGFGIEPKRIRETFSDPIAHEVTKLK